MEEAKKEEKGEEREGEEQEEKEEEEQQGKQEEQEMVVMTVATPKYRVSPPLSLRLLPARPIPPPPLLLLPLLLPFSGFLPFSEKFLPFSKILGKKSCQ